MTTRKVIAFTGAGISQQSGIPTFEEQGDLRNKISAEYKEQHPKEFKAIVDSMKESVDKATPNDAHIVLAEYNIPIITMNVDSLHQKAGSKNVIQLHGTLENPVLYGHYSENYPLGVAKIYSMNKGDVLLIIGVSAYTEIAVQILTIADQLDVSIIHISEDAKTNVRKIIENIFINMEE